MKALKAATTTAAITPANATMTWPQMELPAPHPTFGATGETNDSLQKWYSDVQGALNKHLSNISATINQQADQIESLTSQLKTTTKK